MYIKYMQLSATIMSKVYGSLPHVFHKKTNTMTNGKFIDLHSSNSRIKKSINMELPCMGASLKLCTISIIKS
jgi:hypothetical protein